MNMLTRDLAIDWLQSPLKSPPNRSDENPDGLMETKTAEDCTMKRTLQSIRTFFYANYQLKDSDVDPRNPDKKRMSIRSFLATLIEVSELFKKIYILCNPIGIHKCDCHLLLSSYFALLVS